MLQAGDVRFIGMQPTDFIGLFGIGSTVSYRWFNYFPWPYFAQEKVVAFLVKM
jgi:hypothetical protein